MTPAAGDGARDAEVAAERLAAQLLVLSFRQHPTSLTALTAGSVAAALELRSADVAWAWRWLAVILAIVVMRVVLHLAFVRGGAEAAVRSSAARIRWQRLHEAALVAVGLAWGLLGWYGLDARGGESRYVVLVIISALGAGASGALAPLGWSARAYISLLIVPASVVLFVGQHAEPVLGMLSVAFLVVILVGHRTNRAVLVRSLTLQDENHGLISSLTERNERVQQLNASLERRVVERTRELQEMAHHDTLTGLYNRRGIVERIERGIEDGPAGTTALLFLDLDRFKQINDGLGHDVGDLVLRAVAQRLEASLPAGAAIGRWGGDEFVVVTTTAGDAERCGAIAEALGASLAPPIELDGEQLHVGVSVGIALHPDDGATATALIRAADLAATEVKRTGRGQVRFYHRTLSETQRRRLEIGLGLKEALCDGALQLAYQPIVDATTGHVTSLEALLRWRHPQLGAIGPDEFIPIAEESDRIVELGAWVIRRACLDASTWLARDDHAPHVTVNVSIRQLRTTGFVGAIDAALHDAGLPAHRLEVEVTESVFDPRYADEIVDALAELRVRGMRVHIDDFGSGYSSLARLHEYPIDAVKIDRSFVSNLDDAGRTIVEGAIMISRRFGLGVIAEGVETAAQARTLAQLGVDALQGYWLGVPEATPRTTPFRPTWLEAPVDLTAD